jgi:type II secretory pathway component PulF
MRVKYVAYDETGRRVSGVMEAESQETAQDALAQSGLVVAQISKELRLPSVYDLFPSVLGVKAQHIVGFSRGLATLLEAGIPLRRSLPILAEQTPHPHMRNAILKILRGVEEGRLFSEACSEQSAIFGPLYTRLLRIGEETGRMTQVLHQLAEHLEKQDLARRKIRGSLTYPALVLGMSAISIFILITFSLPALSGLFEEFGADLPFLSKILISVGEFGEAYGGQMVIGLIVFALVLWRYLQTNDGKKRLARILYRAPVIRHLMLAQSSSWFTGNLSTTLSGGITLVEAIELLRANAENEPMQKALDQVLEDLLSGSRLSEALRKHSIFPELVIQTVAVAEESGNLPQQLKTMNLFYEGESDRMITQLTGLIEPAIIIGVGLVVGVVGVTVINTVYSLLPSIQ